MKNVSFCTCTDHACSHHPTNHDNGCTPCIAKNLKQGEIPACFFYKVTDDFSDVHEYTMERFARLVNDNIKQED